MIRCTTSPRCGGTGSCGIVPMSKGGRSAPAISSTRTWRRSGWTSNEAEDPDVRLRLAGMLAALVATSVAAPATAGETPKRGGTLTYMIPADAPPSFDGHRETTYATVHAAAPYYSVLIRVPPDNPASTTEFVCDLCTEMPKPTDGGKTYTFKIRPDVKFHDGAKLTAQDVATSWNYIVFPPKGIT